MSALIEVRDLAVTFESRESQVQAVQNVSFDVQQGESFGLVGESGSGKSTVLRAICGLAPTSAGSIKIDGKPLASPRDPAFYAQVQMVFQDPYGSIHPRHTIDRVLSEPLAIHGFKNAEDRIEKALDDVGLGRGFRFRFPHQLSGGQRQQILLLDEPTSALDASIQAEVLNLLDALRLEKGLTYLLVSHDLAVVAHMCERLLVMQHGARVEELTRTALQSREATQKYTQQLLVASEGFKAP
jgi:peptide/nickel transport system ATP-binding protein